MEGHTITHKMTLVTETCVNCRMVFAMPDDLNRHLRAHPGTSFYCPAGHGQHYQGESEETKLRRERDRLKQKLAEKDDEIKTAWNTATDYRERAAHERHRANGYKGHAARITKRAQAGVCPCCSRTFVALARHMATQHPEFTPETD